MKTKLLLPILMVWASLLVAQVEPIQQWYALTSEQALAYMQGVPLDKHIHKYPFFPNNPFLEDNQYEGYVLSVTIFGDQVDTDLAMHAPISLMVHDLPNAFSLSIFNKTGDVVTDAEVFIETKAMRFDKETQQYQLSKLKRGGLLTVVYHGKKWFYKVDYSLDTPLWKQRWKRTYAHPLGFYFTHMAIPPISMGIFTIRKKRYRRSWKQWKREWNYYWEQPYVKPTIPLYGYALTSKPIYRKGDTLDLSIYLSSKKGKPFTKPPIVFFSGPKSTISLEMASNGKGSFVGKTILGDSLKAGIYTLSIPAIGNRRSYHNFYFQFEIKDYELPVAKATIAFSKPLYYKGDTAAFDISLRDSNGDALEDVRVDYTVLSSMPSDYFESKVFVPDTLWVGDTTLAVAEQIRVPLSEIQWPKCKVPFTIHTKIKSPDGDVISKTASATWVEQPYVLEIVPLDTTIVIRLKEKGISTPLGAELTMVTGEDIKTVKEVELPYYFLPDPTLHYLTVKVDTLKTTWYPHTYCLSVTAVGEMQKDTTWLRLSNPFRQKVQLTWGVGNMEKGMTYIEKDSLVGLPIESQNGVWVRYQTICGGTARVELLQIPKNSQQLFFSTSVPETIVPGESAEIELIITDFNRRPVKNTHIGTSTINSQFEKNPYSISQVMVRRVKNPLNFGYFNVSDIGSPEKNQPEYHPAQWEDLDELQKEKYYKLLYPTKGFCKITMDSVSVSLIDSFALVSPYLVHKGKFLLVAMVYVDRKLVFANVNGKNDLPSYQFAIPQGNHSLTLRGEFCEVTFDYDFFKKGTTTYLSAEVPDLNQNGHWENSFFRTVEKTNIWDYQEVQLINQSFTEIKSPNYALAAQKDYQVAPLTYRKWVGPFEQNRPMELLNTNGEVYKTDFLPSYSYQIDKKRERLFGPNNILNHGDHLRIGKEIGPIKFPERPYHFVEQQQQLSKPRLQIKELGFDCNEKFSFTPNTSKYRFDLPPNIQWARVLLQSGDGSCVFYRDNFMFAKNLPSGNIDLIAMTTKGEFVVHSTVLPEHGLLYEDLRHLTFEKDSVRIDALVHRFFEEKSIPEDFHKLGYFQQPRPINSADQKVFGKVVDGKGEAVILANVVLYQNGNLKAGVASDFNGYFTFTNVPFGFYDIEISSVGLSTLMIKNIMVWDGKITYQEYVMSSTVTLMDVVVLGYKVPMVERDNTTQGQTLTSTDIRNLPTRNITALASTAAGVSSADDEATMRGSRLEATSYYVDGIKVSEEVYADGIARTDFRDNAWFVPHLITDRKGKASFKVSYPEDITTWNTYFVANDERGRRGIHRQSTKAFLPLSARLFTPRFLIAGDVTDLKGLARNLTDDTIDVKVNFKADGGFGASLTERIDRKGKGTTLRVQSALWGQDTLWSEFSVASAQVFDGEKRPIPIYPQGTQITKGQFYVMDGNESITHTSIDSIPTTTVYAEGNLLNVFIGDVNSLIVYPYGCNEQTASRLTALLLKKQVQNLLDKPFKEDSIILIMVNRLSKSQNMEGHWGWWTGGRYNTPITCHVVQALLKADKAGYETPALEIALRWLTANISKEDRYQQLEILKILAEAEQVFPYEATLDTLPIRNVETLLAHTMLRKKVGLPYSVDTLVRLLDTTSHQEAYLEMDNYSNWYYRSTILSLDIYALLEGENYDQVRKMIRNYFLMQRKYSGWNTTFETARILNTLLPELLETASPNEDFTTKIAINGKKLDRLPKKIAVQTPTVQIDKQGVGPAYVTAYQQYWDPNPDASKEGFSIQHYFKTSTGTSDTLALGVQVDLVVDVVVDARSEYVLLEIPIPAGLGYDDTQRNFQWANHVEMDRDKITLFFDRINAGMHQFVIPLETRFSGVYTQNPIRMEEMYFPTIRANTAVRKVVVLE